ncbi:MAG: cytochrome c-type biogenesis protein CcmH [Hyphomonadaceae bacterium]
MKALILLAALSVAPMGDPRQEARATALENEIRCVVCESEPISQSTADIAQDMRRLVRERIAAGDTDTEIRAFFRARYGDFVLLRPGFGPATWLLWAAPLLLLGVGFAAIMGLKRGRGQAGEAASDLGPEIGPEDR